MTGGSAIQVMTLHIGTGEKECHIMVHASVPKVKLKSEKDEGDCLVVTMKRQHS